MRFLNVPVGSRVAGWIFVRPMERELRLEVHCGTPKARVIFFARPENGLSPSP